MYGTNSVRRWPLNQPWFRWGLAAAFLATIWWCIWIIFAPIPANEYIADPNIREVESYQLPFAVSRYFDIPFAFVWGALLNKCMPHLKTEAFIPLWFGVGGGLVLGILFFGTNRIWSVMDGPFQYALPVLFFLVTFWVLFFVAGASLSNGQEKEGLTSQTEKTEEEDDSVYLALLFAFIPTGALVYFLGFSGVWFAYKLAFLMFYGLIVAFIVAITNESSEQNLLYTVFGGLFFGFGFGLIFGLSYGLGVGLLTGLTAAAATAMLRFIVPHWLRLWDRIIKWLNPSKE